MKWILLFSIWYSLNSAPDGAWKYTQIIRDNNSLADCQTLAYKETEQSKQFSNPLTFREYYGFVPRKMQVIGIEYRCVEQHKQSTSELLYYESRRK